jgi:DMSO/TMAO reductase YedYZ molybdopterin-dependent catalytic subunit
MDRRRFLASGGAGGAGLLLGGSSLFVGGCDRLSAAPTFREMLHGTETLNRRVQRTLLWRGALAREYQESDISTAFRANGSKDASSLPPDYAALAADSFADWRLEVTGLVRQPARFSLADLRQLPARSQITRHDCVEGWSCIGQWRGPQLSTLLNQVGLHPDARFIVFRCADERPRWAQGVTRYYESIDLVDALHQQTILAYEMNGAPLPLAHGAPLRLRVERQLGYKMAKFLRAIEVTDRFPSTGRGRGGTWEDDGYEWYAGI